MFFSVYLGSDRCTNRNMHARQARGRFNCIYSYTVHVCVLINGILVFVYFWQLVEPCTYMYVSLAPPTLATQRVVMESWRLLGVAEASRCVVEHDKCDERQQWRHRREVPAPVHAVRAVCSCVVVVVGAHPKQHHCGRYGQGWNKEKTTSASFGINEAIADSLSDLSPLETQWDKEMVPIPICTN